MRRQSSERGPGDNIVQRSEMPGWLVARRCLRARMRDFAVFGSVARPLSEWLMKNSVVSAAGFFCFANAEESEPGTSLRGRIGIAALGESAGPLFIYFFVGRRDYRDLRVDAGFESGEILFCRIPTPQQRAYAGSKNRSGHLGPRLLSSRAHFEPARGARSSVIGIMRDNSGFEDPERREGREESSAAISKRSARGCVPSRQRAGLCGSMFGDESPFFFFLVGGLNVLR